MGSGCLAHRGFAAMLWPCSKYIARGKLFQARHLRHRKQGGVHSSDGPQSSIVVGRRNSRYCEVNGYVFAYAAFPLFTQLSSITLSLPSFESQIPSNSPTTRNSFVIHAFVRRIPSLLELLGVSALRHVCLLFYSCRKTVSPARA